jgi:hypothetical protein
MHFPFAFQLLCFWCGVGGVFCACSYSGAIGSLVTVSWCSWNCWRCELVIFPWSCFASSLAVRFSDVLPCFRLFLAFVRMTESFGGPRACKFIFCTNLIILYPSGSLAIALGQFGWGSVVIDFQTRVLGSTWKSGLYCVVLDPWS